MNSIYLKYLTIASVMLFGSCSLEPEIDNTYGEKFAFDLPDNAEGFLINAYANLPNTVTDDYGGNFLDAATDNAVTNDYTSGIYRLAHGGLTANNNPIGSWSNVYNQFRNIHIFLDEGLGDNVTYFRTDTVNDQRKKQNLKGEAYYLRAWWGFQLLQVYGGKTDNGRALGYPIVLSSQTPEELRNLKSFKRNTYAECVAQIRKDLDEAFDNLPFAYDGGSDPITGDLQLGRADQQAVMALRSRVGVYAASPAYQPGSITQINGMGQFTVNNQSAYLDKWETAAQDAQHAIDLIGNLPGLSEGDFTANNTPNEFIWRSFHNNNSLETQNYPISEFGQARTGPSQNLVDAFYSANGFPITDPRSGYDPANPYENRDPRLDLTVLHNGQELNNDPLQIYNGGEDSNTVYPQNTRTGYYLRKWLSLQPGLLTPGQNSNDRHYNPYLRKAEVYLNFAEAANEAYGPTAIGLGLSLSAVDAINTVRSKAGINNDSYVIEVAAQGKDAFRKLIHRERRLELAFENQRYFDMRRWLLPLNEPVYGVDVTRNDDGTFGYEEQEVETREFNDVKYYYAPLPYDEVVKSDLTNNLGW